MVLKIAISGVTGKMGKILRAKIIANPNEYCFLGGFRSRSLISKRNHLSQLADIIIDFSSPNSLDSLLNSAIEYNTGLVIGTTGFTPEHFSRLKEASKIIPIIYGANMSLGLNLITFLAMESAKVLANFDIEIVEAHHGLKRDVPSGSALQLGQKIAETLGLDFEKQALIGRHKNGLRQKNEIGISSIRGGGIYGDHTVIFAGMSEAVKISHQALNREVFADGALTAAKWLKSKPAGLYSMWDALGLQKRQ